MTDQPYDLSESVTAPLTVRYEYAKAYWAGLTRQEVAELPVNVRRVVSEWELSRRPDTMTDLPVLDKEVAP